MTHLVFHSLLSPNLGGVGTRTYCLGHTGHRVEKGRFEITWGIYWLPIWPASQQLNSLTLSFLLFPVVQRWSREVLLQGGLESVHHQRPTLPLRPVRRLQAFRRIGSNGMPSQHSPHFTLLRVFLFDLYGTTGKQKAWFYFESLDLAVCWLWDFPGIWNAMGWYFRIVIHDF